MCCSCALWLKYGLLLSDATVTGVNAVGLVMAVAYIALHYLLTPAPVRPLPAILRQPRPPFRSMRRAKDMTDATHGNRRRVTGSSSASGWCSSRR